MVASTDLIGAAMLQELVFSLICTGAGSFVTYDGGQAVVNGDLITSTGSARRAERADRAYIEVNGETVRIKPPASIVPNLSGRGDDGWRTMSEVSITQREIRGRFSLNWINKPAVVVNRMTGEVIISGGDILAGSAGFVGDCERVRTDPLF